MVVSVFDDEYEECVKNPLRNQKRALGCVRVDLEEAFRKRVESKREFLRVLKEDKWSVNRVFKIERENGFERVAQFDNLGEVYLKVMVCEKSVLKFGKREEKELLEEREEDNGEDGEEEYLREKKEKYREIFEKRIKEQPLQEDLE